MPRAWGWVLLVATFGACSAPSIGANDGGSDARPDAPTTDALVDDAAFVDDAWRGTDAHADDAARLDAGSCAPIAPSYTCTGEPGACPGGTCISSWCLGPDVDPHRWDACGDGACSDCERDPGCGIDCGAPTRTGSPVLDPSTTITLKLHGLSVGTTGSLDDRTYGEVLADRTLEETLRRFAPDLPRGIDAPMAPNQLVAIDYYGTHPAAWLSTEEIAEIEAHDAHGESALERYALIVAIFLHHRLDESGATGVNIVCHSMGCHVARYLIEHDLRGLASSGRIARVVSVAGALAGAGLADLFDNPALRDYATLSPIQTSDFTHLDPDYVTDHSAVWDHHLAEANSPMWAGILMHALTGTDPVATAAILRPLDVTNPSDEPNDSILYARDTYFVDQAAAVRFALPDATRVLPSHTWHHATHPQMEESTGAIAVAAAALFHHRRVTITLREVTLHDDHEQPGGFSTFGVAPADLACEVRVTYDPFLPDAFGVTGAIVHEQTLADRSAPFFQMREGETLDAGAVLFDAPVFDAQTSLHLAFDLREVDHYPHYGVTELPSGEGSVLGSIDQGVAIADGTITIDTPDVHALVDVRVATLFAL